MSQYLMVKIFSCSLSDISTFIGIVGGFLGAYSFIDNYVLQFKPNIKLGNVLFLVFKKDKKLQSERELYLQSVICKFDIHNKRNKVGMINDLALRIYHSDSINPHGYNLFPFYEIAKFPQDKTQATNLEKSPFASISILSKSSKSISIEFSQHHSSNILNPQREINIELYRRDDRDKWIEVSHHFLFLHDKDPHINNDAIIYSFNIFDWDISRGKIDKLQPHPKSHLYEGIIHQNLRYWLLRPYYVLIIKPFNFIKRGLILAGISISMFMKYLIDKIIILPILLHKSRKVLRTHMTFGRPDLKPVTEKAFKKIEAILTDMAAKINQRTNLKEAKLSIRRDNNGLIISRDRQSLKMYMSGDANIVIQDSAGFNHKLIFHIDAQKFIFGICVWKLNNKMYLTLESICVKVMDAFLLHSAYPGH